MLTAKLHLTGSTYCDGQELIHREMEKGHTLQPENLYLVRDSHNPVDTNAVQVWYDDNGKKVRLGFVQRDQAPEVAECMDDGGSVCAIGVNVCGTADTNYGMYFTVQMTYPCDYEIPDPDAHPDDSIYDGRIYYPYPDDYEMAEEYAAREGSADYGYYMQNMQDEYDGSEEPPYLDVPDIPDDCDWDVSFCFSYRT